MDEQEALLHLCAGSEEEQEAALAFLFDRYYGKIVETLAGRFRLDRHAAEVGAADAFIELRANAETDGLELDGVPGQPYRWLLERAASRTIDETRRNRRQLTGVPKAMQRNLVRHEVEAGEPGTSLASLNPGPFAHASSTETVQAARTAFFEFLDTLEGVDRGILLHDMVVKYELLTLQEAEAFDEQLIGRSHEDHIYTDEALRKRRERLTTKLLEFLDERGIR